VYGALLADLARALAPGAPVEERIARLYDRIARVSDDELMVIRLVVREGLVSSPRLARLFERFQRGHLPLVAAALQDGVAHGQIDARFPPPVLLLLAFAVGGFPQLIRRSLGHLLPFAALPDPAALARLLVDALFHGIAPRAR